MVDGTPHLASNNALFLALAEDLKVPLLRIAYKAELSGIKDDDIIRTSREALQLLDAYLLGSKINNGQIKLALEPVNPTAVLMDTLNDVSAYAKQFSCELRLHAPHHMGTALIHRSALQTALSAITKVFIEAQDVLGSTQKIIELATYNSAKGLSVGVFHAFDEKALSTQLLSQARSHVGIAARPFAGLGSGASTYLFVAEQIVRAMQSDIRSAKRGELSGLAIDLLKTSQMQLVV